MDPEFSGYGGPERRQHRMYVTRNTEYHFRGSVCVAVRDRTTGRWLDAHLAVNRRLTGAVQFKENGTAIPAERGPGLGEALYFGSDGRELVTSVLCEVQRPDKKIVTKYPCTG
jgi:hypothetical protein